MVVIGADSLERWRKYQCMANWLECAVPADSRTRLIVQLYKSSRQNITEVQCSIYRVGFVTGYQGRTSGSTT